MSKLIQTYFIEDFLYLFKEFTKKDFDFFMDTLSVKKMIAYIGKELRGNE